MGIPTEVLEEHELKMLADAIGNCIELTDEFLERYCSDVLEKELKRLRTPDDRAFVLDGTLDDGAFVGHMVGKDSSITMNVGDIEVQFEGKAEDFFDDPDDWSIEGDLAYLNVGWAVFMVDMAGLRDNINEFTEEK